MIGRQRIATVSGLLGALVVLYSGAAPAYADDPKGDCTISEQGDIVCIKKSEIVHKDKKGKYLVKQKQDCQTVERPRLVYPDGNLFKGGDVKSGPTVECSNRAHLPKGYKLPKFKI
jgi:hypothetical protein